MCLYLPSSGSSHGLPAEFDSAEVSAAANQQLASINAANGRPPETRSLPQVILNRWDSTSGSAHYVSI